MFPVYITTGADSLFVGGFALSVVDYWMRHTQADPVTVLDWGADSRFWIAMDSWGYRPGCGKLRIRLMNPDTSQRERHVIALTEAREMGAAWLVQADDDILPRPEFSIATGVRLAEETRTTRPAFDMPTGTPYGLVSVKLPPCNMPHAGDPNAAGPMPVIAEAGAMGGLRFMSTKLDPDKLPPYEPKRRGYDVLLCDEVRAQGMAVGCFWDAAPIGLRATHLRREYSTVWPGLKIDNTFPRPGAPDES